MSLSIVAAVHRRFFVQQSPVLQGSAADSDVDEDTSCRGVVFASSFRQFSLPGFTCASPAASVSAATANSNATSTTRRNDHLAVLIPKHLWKPDSQASHCDIFHCRKSFSLFDRRHHCRKCGGVFCGKCSARFMPLLDTTHLDFFHPPRNVPLSVFESPSSPIVRARVCVECWDQVNGFPSPRTPDFLSSSPITCPIQLASSDSSIISTPPDILPSLSRCSLIRRSQTLPESPQISELSPSPVLPTDDELGELASYPLRHASAVCKKTGGGRWCPKKVTTIDGYRIPGCKAQFEIDMEREEEESRRIRSNPVFKDGDFQYRVPREIEPQSLRGVGPFVLSTF